jgi:gamma-glutamylcyclotransferase
MINKSSHTFLYFAYGANMFSRRLKETIAPSAVAVDIGFIQGRRFSFGKVSRDGSGKCDIEATNNAQDRAYGVLYRINTREKSDLAKAEGVGIGYSEANIQIVTADGTQSSVTYVASYKERVLRPYQWYKAMVIGGAIEHGLPAEYVEWLRTFEAQADANTDRRAEREAILFGNLALERFKVEMPIRQAAVNEV